MGVTVNGGALKKFTFDEQKVKKWYHNGVKVWSGATVVSYYDGLTLIGRLEVDEGADVLHPPIAVVKSGYTHVGWTYNGSRVSSLTAQGETMTITAVFVPNSITVASGTFKDWKYAGGSVHHYPDYSLTVWNSQYISGSAIASATSETWNRPQYGYAYFTLNLGDYTKASGSFGVSSSQGGGSGTIDGSSSMSQSLSGGSHTMTAKANKSDDYTSCAVFITGIVLSNPRPWT